MFLKTLTFCAVASVGIGVCQSAAADISERYGLYFAATLGTGNSSGSGEIHDTSIDDTDVPDIRFTMDDGVGGTVAMGMYRGLFRAEIEGGFRDHALEEFSTDAPAWSVDADVSGMATAMVNVYLDIPVAERLDIYVGGGLGLAGFWTEASYSGPGVSEDFDAYLSAPAAQLLAGLSFRISDYTHLTVGYRFFSPLNAELNWHDVETSWKLPNFDAVEIGLRIDL